MEGEIALLRRPSRWLAAAILTTAVLAMAGSWILTPILLHPSLSDTDLLGVTDPDTRITLQQAQAKLQNDVRSSLLQIFVGLILVVGAAATWRQVHVSRHNHITDLFTRAVDQLANDNVDVRVGGIYALERVARNSPEDRASVAEVLAVFVRNHAPWLVGTPAVAEHPTRTIDDSLPWLRYRAPDIQTALTVLGRRPQPNDEPRPSLSCTDLRKARMDDGWWCDLNFRHTNLAGAQLLKARLDRADLTDVDLRQARVVSTTLRGACLREAHLEGAILRNADLRGADLTDARLDNADLSGVQYDEQTQWPAGFTPAQPHSQPSST